MIFAFVCLIHQTNYLLDQQQRRLEKDFIEQGGLRERMTRVRLQYRNSTQQSLPARTAVRLPPKKNEMDWASMRLVLETLVEAFV